MPYKTTGVTGVNGTFYTGSSNLTATFQTEIPSGKLEPEDILTTVQNFDLLTCANPVAPPFLLPDDPKYSQAGSLVSPFFFKDTSNPAAASQPQFLDERTLFVQPSLTEKVIQDWDGWAISPTIPAENWADPNMLNQINVLAQVPVAGPVPISPGDPFYSVFPMQDLTDWVTHPAVTVSLGGVAIGQHGGVPTPGLVLVGALGLTLNQIQAARTIQPVSSNLATLLRS
jgi:hypothetical protein